MLKIFLKSLLVVSHFSMSVIMKFWSLLGQSKFEVLTLFRNVNHERAYTMLVTAAHYKFPV